MNKEKLKEVLSDKAFVKELFSMTSAEQAQAALEGKGISLSLDEIAQLRQKIAEKLNPSEDKELKLEELESVAGGSDVGDIVEETADMAAEAVSDLAELLADTVVDIFSGW